jgi:predicted nucleic-acid-binding protein
LIAIDTNILIRLVARDDEAQYQSVLQLFSQHNIWISQTVLIESEWVMRGIFAYTQQQVYHLLSDIIAIEGVEAENDSSVRLALRAFNTGMDFADAVHLFTANSNDLPFHTFDKALVQHAQRNNASAQLLTS